ncbi:MAG: c-type cytochrome domain-containing protein, partial [Verrucomicrobiota bacterium]
MKAPSTVTFVIAFAVSFPLAADEKGPKVTFEDDILPILENRCTNCHNPDESKGGLDLSSFSALLGGGSGGDVVTAEDPNSSRLYTLSAHTEEPVMPPRGTKATEKELKLLSDWIAGGLLETKNSKARKSDKPKIDFDSISATGKPEGPPAMPEHLLLEPEVLTDRPNAVPALAHSPWAPIVAVAGQKQVLLYHSKYFDLLGVLPYPEGFPQTLSFSPNGAYLTCGGGRAGKSGNVVTWDLKTGERIIEVGKEYDIVLGADVSPDLKHAVMGGPKRNIKLWDTVAGEETNSIKKHPDWMLTAAYSPDGILFATGGRNGGLYTWEAGTGYEFYTLKGHTAAVTDVAWRSDGNVLASCGEDGQIILWEMNRGSQVKKWNAHSGGALALTFFPDGRLASVGRDKTVKIWQADGKQLRSINASDDIVLSVAVSEDNQRVFTGDWHGNIKVWSVENGVELSLIEPNPPTIEEQLAYSEKRIGQLTQEIPKLEAGVETVSKELTDARNALSQVDRTIADATKSRDSHKSSIGKQEAQVKAFAAEIAKLTEVYGSSQALSKKQNEELQKVSATVKPQQDAVNAATQAFQAAQAQLEKAGRELEAAKVEAAKPALDAETKKKYDQLAAARSAAENAKKNADAAVNAKLQGKTQLVALIEQAKKAVSDSNGTVGQLKAALS